MTQLYEAGITFFEPNEEFGPWMCAEFGRTFFVDCGAGLGTMSRVLTFHGMDGLAIDLFPSSQAVFPITPLSAERFRFEPDMLPILARPCRGAWIRDTIDNAIERAGKIVYIGLMKHKATDLDTLPYCVTLLKENVGADGENVWLISKEPYQKETMSKTFERIVAVVVTQGVITSAPILVGIKDGYKYWNLGRSHCPLNDNTDKIVADYTDRYTSDNDFDLIEIAFAQEFAPKPQPPSARIGWIAPDGGFYPCSYCSHRDLADKLSMVHLGRMGGEADLEGAGWIKLSGDGYCLTRDDSRITEPQKEMVGAILTEFMKAEEEGKDIAALLLSNPEGYSEQMWFTRPNESGRFVTNLKDAWLEMNGEPPSWVVKDEVKITEPW